MLNARTGEERDDDPVVLAYHEAQDRFVGSKVASLQDVLLKLSRIDEIEDLEGHLEGSPRLIYPRILQNLLRDLRSLCESPADAGSLPTASCTSTDDAEPKHALLKGNIDSHLNEIMMHAFDAKEIAGLLEGLSDSGYSEAHSKGDVDWWHKKWWGQASYVARTLERTATELQRDAEELETLLRHGCESQ